MRADPARRVAFARGVCPPKHSCPWVQPETWAFLALLWLSCAGLGVAAGPGGQAPALLDRGCACVRPGALLSLSGPGTRQLDQFYSCPWWLPWWGGSEGLGGLGEGQLAASRWKEDALGRTHLSTHPARSGPAWGRGPVLGLGWQGWAAQMPGSDGAGSLLCVSLQLSRRWWVKGQVGDLGERGPLLA